MNGSITMFVALMATVFAAMATELAGVEAPTTDGMQVSVGPNTRRSPQ